LHCHYREGRAFFTRDLEQFKKTKSIHQQSLEL
jgi:hypothetical protein